MSHRFEQMAAEIAYIKRECQQAQQMYNGLHKAFNGLAPKKTDLKDHEEVKRHVEISSGAPRYIT